MDRISLSETILRYEEAVAKPAPSLPEERPIRFGLAKGQIAVADDFDDPLPEDLLKTFYGLEPDEDWPEFLL
ncbi:hypothetical protein ACIU1J_11180 [Azospirillum doebereinerae]|uniref:hypothetical protein n=1 Tax=Azospirillum doebereinerae TaxID=92933 RepID=UPI00384F02F9|nr:hypothetical protein [Azospirillum doebereinerae]